MINLNPDRGQHLLVDAKAITKEVEVAKITKKDRIIEIGAGTGNLTKELVKKAEKVLVFEIDVRFKEELRKLKKENKNLEVIYEDALKHDWKGYNKIVSNIPYFIAGDLILKSIKDNIEEIVIIVGENFKEILEKKRGKSGIIGNLFFEINYISEVERQSFEPVPKVNSWLIKLKEKKLDKVDSTLKKILCKNGKIKNAILYSLVEAGKTKNQAREFIFRLKLEKRVLNKPVQKITGRFLIRLKEELEK